MIKVQMNNRRILIVRLLWVNTAGSTNLHHSVDSHDALALWQHNQWVDIQACELISEAPGQSGQTGDGFTQRANVGRGLAAQTHAVA
jgi:hypothetical protein